ncbi:MAG: pirin family protein [Caulobacter sp.]|nr:pirin family protein [Caulobacter sp.]
MAGRTIKARHGAYRDDIADLVTRRPVPGPGVQQVDPFLFLNHHGPQVYPPNNRGLPFRPHPHRGFETVTFILEGELSHLDSGGHESVIRAGGIQWMTAGSGLVHAELSPDAFKRAGGPLEILQLWVNLPAALKFAPPRYVGLQREDIPVAKLDEGRVEAQVIAGRLGDVEGPYDPLVDIFMATIAFKPGGSVSLPAAAERNVFLYIVRGEVAVGGAPVKAHELVELNGDGQTVELSASSDAVVLFGHAVPFGEPVVSHGPFVMNTREQIVDAINDYNAGKFGVVPG